ncbi:hypothetical protein HNR19_000954 [Nocardioides thalensis]|uniref:Uncharacterized protein n=1 Tax=Nocardioides thalensis TaxID=1914755 RepID=A0A853BZQ3_9ACTN|nr:hypothetical protein [Nocardioides thalensis]NYJ00256.1 hypothetical protein [Nocardioides thalensis]
MAATCNVLRCTSEGAEIVDVSGEHQLRLEAIVCTEHKANMDAGARWVWDDQMDARAPLLMGEDLPPVLTSSRMEVSHMSSLGRTKMLRLEFDRGDGTSDYVIFELTPEAAEGIKNLSRTM